MDLYDKVFLKVIGHEGGYVNDPDDPGGETKYGISKRSYPNEDIKNLTLERAKEIYKNDYWNMSKCNDLPDELKYIHFDTAINMGIITANKLLQKSVGASRDGVIGPKTIDRINRFGSKKKYAVVRLHKYTRIILLRRTSLKYSEGWIRRVLDILETEL